MAWGWWMFLSLLATVGLSVFASLHLALRLLSRPSSRQRFEDRPARSLSRLIERRVQYIYASTAAESILILLLILGVWECAGAGVPSIHDRRAVSAIIAAFLLILVFGAAIPEAWAKYRGERLVLTLLPVLRVLRIVFLPVIVLLGAFEPLVRRLTGATSQILEPNFDSLSEDVDEVDEEEKEMIESVIDLTDQRVDKIMRPRTQIVALPVETDRAAVMETIRTKGHSRIPIYDGTIDTIVGVLYAKDFLLSDPQEPLQLLSLIRKPLFVPESKFVRDLLREFQASKVHMAVVLDEYGGTAGLVTIEDILEELVGEIADEHDSTRPHELKRIDDQTIEVDARMRIKDLNDQLQLTLPEDRDFETIAGFVFSTLGHIPMVGEHCAHANVGIHVIGADPRRITRLRINVKQIENGRQPA